MTDCRKYRGYVIPNPELSGREDRWLVRFPDFPEIELKAGNEAMDPTGIIAERACDAILNAVLDMLQEGRQVPVPHTPIQFAMSFEIEIDLDSLRSILRLNN